MIFSKRSGIFTAVAALVLFSISYWPDWFHQVLCYPPAWLASVFYNIPLQTASNGFPELAHPEFPVTVARSCSGSTFWFLLTAVSTWTLLPTCAPRVVLVLLPVVTLTVTLLVNALRIILSISTWEFSLQHFSVGLHSATHLATGVITFLPALILFHLLLERKFSHVRS